MLLFHTTLWITIQLAVIKTSVSERSSNEKSTQSATLGSIYTDQPSPDISSVRSPEHAMDFTTRDLGIFENTSDRPCQSVGSHNIINMNLSEIEALIQSQVKEIREKNVEITQKIQDAERNASNFAKIPNVATGRRTLKLACLYQEKSRELLESIKKHNLLIKDYKCITNESKTISNISEIPEKEFEVTLKHNEYIWTQFEYLLNLTSMYKRLTKRNGNYSASMNKYNATHALDDLHTALEEMRVMTYMMGNFVQKLTEFYMFMGNNTLYETFQTQQMFFVSNIKTWERDLQRRKEELKSYEKYVDETNFTHILNRKIQPVVHGIIFAVGFLANLILLIIFARHKELRNPPSMMILNLTLADSLNLPINIPAYYMYLISHSWQYGEGICITFRFFRQLGIAISIYSIVVISIQRFIALTQIFKNTGWSSILTNRVKSVLLILSVWIIGSLIAVPHTIHAGIYNGQCYGAPNDNSGYDKFIVLFDLILFCAIPLTIIATLSLTTALVIRRSVRNIPGEQMKSMDKYVKTRIVSANVLIALTVVSAASYAPYYFFMFLHVWKYIQINKRQYQIIFFVLYTFVFANCCFNPIALYIFSHKFRKYIHKYLFCRKIDEGYGSRKLSSGTTTSITMKI